MVRSRGDLGRIKPKVGMEPELGVGVVPGLGIGETRTRNRAWARDRGD